MDSPELTAKIGQRLRAERKSLKLSLADLSERTGTLSKSRISNYEQGIRRMGLEEARILADALGTVTPAYLLCLEDTRGSESPEEQSLIRYFRESDDRHRRLMLNMAESIHTNQHGDSMIQDDEEHADSEATHAEAA